MGSFSLVHWLVLGLVIILFMGPSRFAASGKGLGEGIRNFKKGLAGEDEDEEPVVKKKKPAKPRPSDDSEEDG